MNLLTRASISAISSATALLVASTLNINAAQAALYRFSLEGERVNGYFIYDTSFPAFSENTGVAAYIGASTEYKFDLGEKGIFQGKSATPIVYLARNQYDSNVPIDKESDIFTFEVRGFEREPESAFSFLAEFYYPKDTFEGSTALPTSVPSSVRVEIHPNVQVPDRGEPAYIGFVQTRIEKVPEPTLLPALLGVGAWFLFRRQHRQLLSYKNNYTKPNGSI